MMKKIMKVFTMVLFVVGMTAFTSCSKSNADLILGKWELQKASMQQGDQTFEFTIDQLAEMLGDESYDLIDPVLEFKNDGFVYNQEGDKYPYSVKDNVLTITGYDEDEDLEESMSFTIVELTKTSLAISGEQEDVLVTLYFKKA